MVETKAGGESESAGELRRRRRAVSGFLFADLKSRLCSSLERRRPDKPIDDVPGPVNKSVRIELGERRNENEYRSLYCNADGLMNKRQELKAYIDIYKPYNRN